MNQSPTATRIWSAIAVAQRCSSGRAFQRARSSLRKPTCSTAPPSSTSLATFRRSFAEQSLGAEDEDQDQDREDDRLGPVGARRVPGESLIERLDAADQ